MVCFVNCMEDSHNWGCGVLLEPKKRVPVS